MLLPVWLPGPMFLQWGFCPWSHVPSGGPCPGGSTPPKSKRRAVRILLECFLVFYSECLKRIYIRAKAKAIFIFASVLRIYIIAISQ